MTTKSDILSAVSCIERAPDVTLLMRAVDAVLGSNAMGIARIGARWEVSENGFAIYQADFTTVRRRLASYVMDACSSDEVDELSEQFAPAMVSQPAQLQQARDTRSTAPPSRHLDRATIEEGDVVARLLDGLLREDADGDLAQALVTVHAASAHLNSANSAYTSSPSKAALALQWRARFMHLQATRHYNVMLEIDAIGHLQIGYGLRPCLNGIAVIRGDETLFDVPLGTERRGIETALRIHDDAYSAGHGAGRAAAMADFRAFIGEPA